MQTDPGAAVMCQAALWGSVAPVLPHLEPDESDSALEESPFTLEPVKFGIRYINVSCFYYFNLYLNT